MQTNPAAEQRNH